nr:hypothetical protein [Tanacetum cinerariifolium]
MKQVDYWFKFSSLNKIECSSCGALYTKSRGCSKEGFIDKYVHDRNKTPDSSQRPPHDCPRCGSPVDGLYSRDCALLRKKLKEVWFTICDEHKFFQDFLNTSNDDSNVVNMPQEPIVLNQDPGENSSQSPPQIDNHCCYGCGNSLDGIFCQECTCKSCGKGAHYDYNCPPKVLIIFNLEPYHDQNVEEFPQILPSSHPTCYSGDENSFIYDSTPNLVKGSPNIFNPRSQPPMYCYEFCGDNAHYSYDCSPQVPFIYDPEPCPHVTVQCQSINYYEPNPCYNYSDFDNFKPSQPVIDHLNLQQRINDSIIKLCGTFQAWLQQQKDQVCQKIPLCCNDNDDEESSIPLRDVIISELHLCIAITPVVSTKDSLIMEDENLDTILETKLDGFIKFSVENLIPNPSESEDERECDVPAWDDFTTFSNLLFDINDDFSSSDNESFSDKDIPKEIYSNPLFDEEIISIKIDPYHFNAESDLIESLLNQDSLIISSSKIDSPLDEFASELILLKSIPLGIDEDDCDPEEEIRLTEKLLYNNSSPRPLEEFIFENYDAAIESISPSPIPVKDSDSLRDEIDLFLTSDDSIPLGIDDDDYDSERDILILEELLSNDSLSLPENESFQYDIPSSPRPQAKPPDDDEIEPNSRILTVKVVGDIFEHYVPMPRILPTQPTHASNQEKSPHLLSHRGLKAFQLPSKSPMMIYRENIPILDVPFLHFYPH